MATLGIGVCLTYYQSLTVFMKIISIKWILDPMLMTERIGLQYSVSV